MTKKENLFQEHCSAVPPYLHPIEETATDHTNITLAYHKKCLELILEEWTKGKFQETLSAMIRRDIEELK